VVNFFSADQLSRASHDAGRLANEEGFHIGAQLGAQICLKALSGVRFGQFPG